MHGQGVACMYIVCATTGHDVAIGTVSRVCSSVLQFRIEVAQHTFTLYHSTESIWESHSRSHSQGHIQPFQGLRMGIYVVEISHRDRRAHSLHSLNLGLGTYT